MRAAGPDGPGGCARPRALLGRLYRSVLSLLQLSDRVRFSDGRGAELLRDSDSARLATLIRGLVICSDSPLPRAASRAQLTTLPEVLALVLNHLKRRKKRNILGFGYHNDQQGDVDPFKFHGALFQSSSFIRSSDLWVTINQRLGTEVTRFLLQDCAVFTTAPPSCLVQLCGAPVYDLVPARTWSGFLLTSDPLGTWRRRGQDREKNRAMTTRRGRIEEEQGEEDDGATSRTKNGTHKRRKTRAAGRKENQPEPRRANADEENIRKRKRRSGEDGEEEQSKSKKTLVEVVEHGNIVPAEPIEADGPDSRSERVGSASSGHGSWKPGEQPPPRPPHCAVRVLGMLYCGRGMKGFLLNRKVRGGVAGAVRLQGAELVRIVFLQGNTSLSRAELKPRKLPKRFFSMVPLFSQLLRQHRKCPYAQFLRQKCSGGEGKQDMRALLPAHCCPYRVYLFVRAVLRYVVPDQLWGSDHNLLHFLSQVKHFLRLGRFERLSLAQLMWRMRVSDCLWAGHRKRHCPSEQRYREWLVGQFLLWLMGSFVVGLVKAMFYVTETMAHKYVLRFYRWDIWHRLQDLAFREHLSKGQLVALTPQQVASLSKSTVTSRLRFIPKANSMRPITRLSGTGAVLQQYQACVRDLLNVLGLCVHEKPSLLGSTVWGKQDIHRVLSSIAPQHKLQPQPLYFVKVDVSGAYDSLPHTKLQEVVGEVLEPIQEASVFFRHYVKLWSGSSGGIRKKFCTKTDMFQFSNMKWFAVEEQKSRRLHNSVLVERYSMDTSGKDVFQFFKQMLSSYVVHHEQRWFQQVCGIPQGSAVSTMLCNLCYGHMENSLLKNMTEKGGCLMRLVDDFLLITPQLNKALQFLKILLDGIPDYGCKVNPLKVAVNFPVSDSRLIPEISEFPMLCLFPWCGLLINTRNLEIYNDYSRYAGQSVRYSLTVGSAPSAAEFMRQKLQLILRLKCNAIFLDLRLNSVEAVFRNIYKVLLLQALRFHVCVKSLPLGQDVNRNPTFFLKMIRSLAKSVHRSFRSTNSDCVGVQDPGVLQYESVDLLTCLAFVVILTRHRPSYSGLLPQLCRDRRRLCAELRGPRLVRVLRAASPRIPPDFTKIRS